MALICINAPVCKNDSKWCFAMDVALKIKIYITNLICVLYVECYGLVLVMINNEKKQLAVNRSISQIPQCTSPISQNVPLCNRNVCMCAHFCHKMVHCGIFIWCIVGLVKRGLFIYPLCIMVIEESLFKAALIARQAWHIVTCSLLIKAVWVLP